MVWRVVERRVSEVRRVVGSSGGGKGWDGVGWEDFYGVVSD
jgi:hypothetical protein